MPEQGNALSRNPNICASCSSMADGMEESNLPESVPPKPDVATAPAEDQPQRETPAAFQHYVPL